ncbi:Protein TolB [termite gut metagenome]|uniref:Protein TolB n=1 Tax=termite gut metagenome TaxID=433724 RepID=A0A5J4R0G1_9ZZZZ
MISDYIHTFCRIFLVLFVALFSSCRGFTDTYVRIDRPAAIYPAYQSTTIPYNMAPLNFAVREEGSPFRARFSVAGKDSFDIQFTTQTDIPLRKWKKLLKKHRGESLHVSLFAKQSQGWVRYTDLVFFIASEAIDPYLVYRLIEPGYEVWGKMGIYQRCIENFDESPVILNSLTGGNCMNCHSFCRYNPDKMLFHTRGKYAGTLFVNDGILSKINTKTPEMVSAGVYPRWHPEGRYVAFSNNTTKQNFHTIHANKVEVYDMASGIVIYDTETNTVFTDSLISSQNSFETFPEWSPDGRFMYFCSAITSPMPMQYNSLYYDLLRISFDPSTARFGNKVDTLVHASAMGKSVSLPRVSPVNNCLVFCLSNYGTFPIWHKENDLYLLDLENGKIANMANINSVESDSYHSWSSNGRWLVFGSRRLDGMFTRLFICYFDVSGIAHTPFLLPQKDPLYYDYSLKSYNIPEFISGKIKIPVRQFVKTILEGAINAKSN